MHHFVVDQWSRRAGWLQPRDPRAKLVVLVSYLVCVATLKQLTAPAVAAFALLPAVGAWLGRLPAGGVALRASLVLPFAGLLAAAGLLSGQGREAASLLVRAYLSAAAVVVVAGTTPLPALLRGLERLGAPRFFVLVVQFLYRYLFVLSEQAQHMRLAAAGRGVTAAGWRRNRSLWRAAGGALAVLFARSQARAEGIHRAMLARGYQGRVEWLGGTRMGVSDWLFVLAGVILSAAIRMSPLAGS